jgi:hypothetical protein
MRRVLAMLGALVPGLLFVLIFGAAASGCASTLAPGDFGTFRFGGRVKGSAPLRLLPPIADRTANVYVLNGALDFLETNAFVAHAGGGWTSGCSFTKGDNYGAHGWSGYSDNQAWYWSGDALVAVPGTAGLVCHRVLDHDPGTDADLLFRGVLPWVRVQSERTTLVALVQSPTDPVPFSALVDLNAEILTNVTQLDPPDAQSVTVAGVGADGAQGIGVALLQYKSSNGADHLEARFYDLDANPTGAAVVGGGPLGPYSVVGYLQIGGSGRVAGLVAPDKASPPSALVTFDRSGGGIAKIDPGATFQPVGVHAWDGGLWLVGERDGQPMLAPIDSGGNVGAPVGWGASQKAAAAIGGTITVRDDRSLPARATSWAGVKSAIGDLPFLSAHRLTEHAPGTTLWLIAGPSFQANDAAITSFAMAPVGVSYP